jgi:hypothetical protein
MDYVGNGGPSFLRKKQVSGVGDQVGIDSYRVSGRNRGQMEYWSSDILDFGIRNLD